jgi:hypothetical protein
VIYRSLGRHLLNPDHPAVGHWLVPALQGTAKELATRRPRAASRPVPTDELAASLHASGLELPDEVRIDCNRLVAGKWLYDFLGSGNKAQDIPDTLEKLDPAIAATCRNPSLASATVVRIPAPRFPRLDSDASPLLVRADGSYRLAGESGLEDLPPSLPDYNARDIRVQLSHWRQLLALPLVVRAQQVAQWKRAGADRGSGTQNASFIAMASSASFARLGRARAGMSLRAAIWSLL